MLNILLPLTCGLTIFLFGMKVMEIALQQWAGPMMKNILEKFTKTPFHGLLTGTVVTAFLQSSTAITVITIGMVNAGMMTFPRTLGIILGTNIGTCVTTELIATNIHRFALPLLLGASAIWLGSWLKFPDFVRANAVISIRAFSLAVCGFSTLLLGMQVMQTIVPSLQEHGLMTWFLERSLQSLLWGIVAGAALTAVIQSSTATIAMTMGFVASGILSLELGIAIVLGANIGTCLTALIASIGGSRSGQAVAWSHVVLNVAGAIVFYPLIPLLQTVSVWISDAPEAQLAHAQTIYNIVCSLVALPLCYLPVFSKRSFQ